MNRHEPKAVVRTVTLTKGDDDEIKAAADRMTLPIATWMRMVMLDAARAQLRGQQ